MENRNNKKNVFKDEGSLKPKTYMDSIGMVLTQEVNVGPKRKTNHFYKN